MAFPVPIPAVPIPTQMNPGNDTLQLSTSGVDTQDWLVHIQTVEMMYLRNNKYNTDTSSSLAAPVSEFNYLDVNYTVQTTDEIYYDATFSGELYQPQTLELISTEASAGGFGVCGVINTSEVGYIRRLVRKDAAGNILDTTGTCSQTGNLILDKAPGAYGPNNFDTSSQVNSNLSYVLGEMAGQCPSFKASLVDL